MANISRFGLYLVCLVISFVGCATPPKLVPDEGSMIAEFPVMSVGDTWTALEHNDKYGTEKYKHTVTSVDPDGSFTIGKKGERDTNERFKYFDVTANGVPMLMGIQFDPEALQFPLFAGKTWRTTVEATSVDGEYLTYNSKYVVEEYTTVETDLGMFEAFPIKAVTVAVETNWRGKSRYWYAPAAKTIVKSTHEHIRGTKILEMNLAD